MSALDYLAEMVTDKFRVRATGNYLILKEPNQDDFHLEVNGQYFALTLDHKPMKGDMDAGLPFLKRAGLTCKCDLIVFAPKSTNETVVFVIELKSLAAGDYLKQLRSSKAFASYLAEVGLVHGKDLGKLVYRGLVIKSRKIPAKGCTRMPKVEFTRKVDLDVCEWDRAYPLGLHLLLQAA